MYLLANGYKRQGLKATGARNILIQMTPTNKAAAWAAGLFLILFSFSASAFSMTASTDSLVASSCSSGVVAAMVWNAVPGSKVAFSAETGYAGVRVENPQAIVPSSGGAAANFIVSPPACLSGAYDIRIYAQVCGNTCETQVRIVRVSSTPCATDVCNNPSNSIPGMPAVATSTSPFDMCGDTPCYNVQSNAIRETNYLATSYSASLNRNTPARCLTQGCIGDQIMPGGRMLVSFNTANTGAAGSFTVSAWTDAPNALGVTPAIAALTLQRSESATTEFIVSVNSNAAPGLFHVYYSLSHAGVEVDTTTQFVQVIGTGSCQSCGQAQPQPNTRGQGIARITYPSSVQADACNPPDKVAIPAMLYNEGRAQAFRINANVNGKQAYSNNVQVDANSQRNFEILLDYSTLSLGTNIVQISSDSPEFEGSGTATIAVVRNKAQTTVKPAQALNGSGNKIALNTVVANNGDCWLSNVHGELSGLPQGWTYSSAVIEIPPKSEANLTIIVLANTAETVTPALTIKSGDKVVGTQAVGEINRPATTTGFSILTGLFLGSGLSNYIFTGEVARWLIPLVFIMLLIAAIFLLAAYRNNQAHLVLDSNATQVRTTTTTVTH